MNILPNKILLPSWLKFPLLPQTKCDGYKCKQLIIKSHLIKISVSKIGVINNFPFDILRHIGNTDLYHVIFLTTSPIYLFLILHILPYDFLWWPFFDPPPQSFTCRANSVRLSSAFSTLTSSPGTAMSNSFTSNCLSAEVIFLISGFLDFSCSKSAVWIGAQDVLSPIKSLLLISRSSGWWPIALSCQMIERMALMKTMILTAGLCISE